MPLRFPRFKWRVRLRHPAALLLAVALFGSNAPPIATGLVNAAPGVVRLPHASTPPSGPIVRWTAIEGPLSPNHQATAPVAAAPSGISPVPGPILRPGLALGQASRVVDDRAPSASLEPLTVEQGELTLRWNDTDGSGSGIARRIVRIEAAPATPTACGTFTVASGVPLEAGDDTEGWLSLGTPPSSGCLRASLELTDRVGRRSTTISEPYRIQPTAEAEPAPPAWSGKFNLFRSNAFVTQKTFRWCVAASVQMMVNIVRHKTDRSRATQARMIAYAQRWDNGPYGEEGGTDVTGWIAALRHYGAGRYRVVGATTAARALRIAAIAMRQTGRPAGILVMEGRHAWVLHGFESRTDPKKSPWANITAVRVSGPLYPVQQANGYDPRPNSRMTVRALERYFQPTIVGVLVGRYVVGIPTH
jgi:hypothetical protein